MKYGPSPGVMMTLNVAYGLESSLSQCSYMRKTKLSIYHNVLTADAASPMRQLATR